MKMKKKKLEKLFADEYFIEDVCRSYRHDFDLMSEEEKEKLILQYKEWMRSILYNYDYHKWKMK